MCSAGRHGGGAATCTPGQRGRGAEPAQLQVGPTLYRKPGKKNPRKETARPQSQFLQSYICERFINSRDPFAYVAATQ